MGQCALHIINRHYITNRNNYVALQQRGIVFASNTYNKEKTNNLTYDSLTTTNTHTYEVVFVFVWPLLVLQTDFIITCAYGEQ